MGLDYCPSLSFSIYVHGLLFNYMHCVFQEPKYVKTSRFGVFQTNEERYSKAINRPTDCCLGRFPCNSESLRTKNDWVFISWNAKQVVS